MFVYRFIRLYRNVPHPLAPTVFSNRKKKKKLLPLFLKDTSQSDKPNQYYQVTMYETWICRIVQLRKSD